MADRAAERLRPYRIYFLRRQSPQSVWDAFRGGPAAAALDDVEGGHHGVLPGMGGKPSNLVEGHFTRTLKHPGDRAVEAKSLRLDQSEKVRVNVDAPLWWRVMPSHLRRAHRRTFNRKPSAGYYGCDRRVPLVRCGRQMTDRFSSKIHDILERNEYELGGFSERLTHLLTVEQEFTLVTRRRPFLVYHDTMWRMLLGETDMVIVDLASWALGFYEKKGGGLLRSLRGPDLEALQLKWDYTPGPVINLDGQDHPEIDAYQSRLNAEWRQKAFSRLFPNGTSSSSRPNIPCQADIDCLCVRLNDEFETLLRDRNQHRAHRYEKAPKTAATLSLADVTEHLKACQDLLADIRCLSSNSVYSTYRYRAEAHRDDHDAQDVVDLILLGDLRTLVDAPYGPKSTEAPSPGYWHQRRTAHYERLHQRAEARGKPEEPFNDRSLIGLHGE